MAAVSYQPNDLISPQEYLEIEAQSLEKHEYFNGRMWPLHDPENRFPHAMAGASTAHVRLTGAVYAALHSQLRGSTCEPMMNDQRIRIQETGLYAYPDVLVVCEPEYSDDRFDTITDPVAIIEVLSPSTAAYDRGDKWAHYQLLPSLRDYVLVAQNQMRVEHFARQEGDAWLLNFYQNADDVFMLSGVNAQLNVGEIYERIIFDNPTTP